MWEANSEQIVKNANQLQLFSQNLMKCQSSARCVVVLLRSKIFLKQSTSIHTTCGTIRMNHLIQHQSLTKGLSILSPRLTPTKNILEKRISGSQRSYRSLRSVREEYVRVQNLTGGNTLDHRMLYDIWLNHEVQINLREKYCTSVRPKEKCHIMKLNFNSNMMFFYLTSITTSLLDARFIHVI